MRSHKRDQAAVSVIVPKGGIRGNDGAQAGGLDLLLDLLLKGIGGWRDNAAK